MPAFFRVWVRKLEIRFHRRRGVVWSFFLFYFACLALFSLVGDRGLWASYQLWRESQRLSHSVETLKSQNEGLRTRIRLYREDRRTLERHAREELHLAADGEIHYIFR